MELQTVTKAEDPYRHVVSRIKFPCEKFTAVSLSDCDRGSTLKQAVCPRVFASQDMAPRADIKNPYCEESASLERLASPSEEQSSSIVSVLFVETELLKLPVVAR